VTSVLLLLKISWRNLWRNPRGTLLTALALGLGLALLLISLGLLDGGHEQAVADGVRLGPGDVVVQAKGYQDIGSQELLLAAPTVLTIEKFLQSEEMKHLIVGASPRLLATGLLSSPANAASVRMMGVIPREERTVSLIPQRIVAGNYLSNDAITGVVIGVELARKLEVKIGSKVVLMTQSLRQPGIQARNGAAGEMQSTVLRVSGLFLTGIEAVDTNIINLPLPVVQTLLGVRDHRLTQVAIMLDREGDSPMVAKALRTRLTDSPVEVLTGGNRCQCWRRSLGWTTRLIMS
jgi:ABC-type lipoprotein release transport system permease subunit